MREFTLATGHHFLDLREFILDFASLISAWVVYSIRQVYKITLERCICLRWDPWHTSLWPPRPWPHRNTDEQLGPSRWVINNKSSSRNGLWLPTASMSYRCTMSTHSSQSTLQNLMPLQSGRASYLSKTGASFCESGHQSSAEKRTKVRPRSLIYAMSVISRSLVRQGIMRWRTFAHEFAQVIHRINDNHESWDWMRGDEKTCFRQTKPVCVLYSRHPMVGPGWLYLNGTSRLICHRVWLWSLPTTGQAIMRAFWCWVDGAHIKLAK